MAVFAQKRSVMNSEKIISSLSEYFFKEDSVSTNTNDSYALPESVEPSHAVTPVVDASLSLATAVDSV